ncbi:MULTISPECIES: adenosylcobalamin/alpha-ribazole phosphatase [unclassified Brenneria]|uniref:adenosylcobalamin/alpha-ribazole phosphatase n=1 Tax=unclassified Brenneria TaxID=2634434 RepID=UPI0015526B9B|nr:adenosylcobalamin/alpha-ribazole phosphatase [Brenneria sp. hezel4-2-4]MEE3651036.1 adenosylcobalamin/alpha-ribazole phosphatase [Brenneria sp. HEZEL_4_2_4]NPD00991.1 adenosylcobalamin/alpha-ribazole phosphatase [Brenneria sp. hezel4-2-4]
MRLFLVRHGQTEANLSGVFCGSTDVGLTENGVAQARQTAGWLADVVFSSAVSSALWRAKQTAEIVLAARGITAIADPCLNEMHFGDWEMRHHRDLQHEDAEGWAAWVADWQQASPTGGEAFPAFAARVENFAQTLLTQNTKHNQLIVAHQGGLSLLLATLLAMPPSAMWHFHFDQDAYSVLDIQDGFVTLKAFNHRARWLSV